MGEKFPKTDYDQKRLKASVPTFPNKGQIWVELQCILPHKFHSDLVDTKSSQSQSQNEFV